MSLLQPETSSRNHSSNSSSTEESIPPGNSSSTSLRRRRHPIEGEPSSNPWDADPENPADPYTPHPLTPDISRTNTPFPNLIDTSEASRPSLRRLTSEVEKEVAIASAASRSSIDETSARGSLDLLRSALGKLPGPNEVEVLVHDVSLAEAKAAITSLFAAGSKLCDNSVGQKVKPKESLMGIALKYGIDVATLRKANKLWTSDSVHLRRHLYVPLESCRWAQATEGFIRGPGEGQITLVSKSSLDNGSRGEGTSFSGGSERLGIPTAKRNGKEREASTDLAESFLPSTNVAYGDLVDLREGRPSRSRSTSSNLRDLLKGIDGIDVAVERTHTPDVDPAGPVPSTDRPPPAGTVLSVIRIPASELAFFPKAKQAPSRKSLDALSLIHETPPPMRRSPSSNFPSPLHASHQAFSSSGTRNGSSSRPFTTSSMTPSTWSAASTSKSKSSKPDLASMIGSSAGHHSKKSSTGTPLQPKDRPFEMTARRAVGAISLPLDAGERELAKRQAAESSWFTVADDGIDPARSHGGWG